MNYVSNIANDCIDIVNIVINEQIYNVISVGFNITKNFDPENGNRCLEIPNCIYQIDYLYYYDGNGNVISIEEVEIDGIAKLEITGNTETKEIITFKKFVELYKPKLILSGNKDYEIPFVYISKLYKSE